MGRCTLVGIQVKTIDTSCLTMTQKIHNIKVAAIKYFDSK